jgi:hypothetical protein
VNDIDLEVYAEFGSYLVSSALWHAIFYGANLKRRFPSQLKYPLSCQKSRRKHRQSQRCPEGNVIQNLECTTNLSLFTNNAKHKGPHWWKFPRYSKYASCILSHPLDGWHIELKWGKCARAKTDSDELKGKFGTISSGLRTYCL